MVGLIQKACEEVEIQCTTISIIDELTQKLHTRRYLSVPYELGYPLGYPDDFTHPAGGYNNSGIGKDMGRVGIEEYYREKSIWIPH